MTRCSLSLPLNVGSLLKYRFLYHNQGERNLLQHDNEIPKDENKPDKGA